ncbi:putative mitochondrial genome maintenance protein [Phaeoacremonium minimum UCRPA7]|uniref:Putative mitochondrial genome maintenance protein n=1 Tax=Phaeoacremonium minimum (strain UCR-PA7) TaxID=1286976 RepID=R8BQL5_PHAM7|nr:putative mitochondrial genome maintenance protein [Phaeoacremonium minimum UCRPA7]EOO01673.1 putative mitochondrial genome maintenance protein [Phaeoacremonium minimum UCRPA7]
MPVPVNTGHAGPSNFDKAKMGAMMGGRTVNIFRYGAGPNGIMRTLGQYMLGSGATFGFFMSIGSVIRSDASPIVQQAYANARRRPMIMQQAYKAPFPRN